MDLIRVRNRGSLLSLGNRRERRLILDCVELGLQSVAPSNLLDERVNLGSNTLHLKDHRVSFRLRDYDNVFVIGGGKASGAMAEALEEMLSDDITDGYVNVLKGTKNRFHTKKIKLNEASHPVPDRSGVKGAAEMIKILRRSTKRTLVICLISGGGSALIPLPAKGITLGEMVETTNLLLRSGADIDRMNCVRKHISGIKGGQLVTHVQGATVLSLIISDVVGDHLESIASGPTVPDPTTFSDSKKILEELGLLDKVPVSVKDRILAGCGGMIPDTPKPNDPIFLKVYNVIIGSNRIACERIKQVLLERGGRSLRVEYLGSSIRGEASIVAKGLASKSFRSIRSASDHAFVWGGETTVTVKGNGIGGRNQEEALSALEIIGEAGNKGMTVAFFGSDGIDGRTNSAGAIVDLATFESAQKRGLSLRDYLERNDSNTFFKRARNSLIITGATGTNVNDIGVAIVRRRDQVHIPKE